LWGSSTVAEASFGQCRRYLRSMLYNGLGRSCDTLVDSIEDRTFMSSMGI
jgi:hypothetical protein